MATSKQAVNSLLTEHFRYTPLTLLDDIINTVNELIYRAVTAVEEGLSSAPPSSLGFAQEAAAESRLPEKDDSGNDFYPESKVEIEEGVHRLETLLQATVDKNFDKFEIYVLRNILSVPEDVAPWVRLAHYENLDLTRHNQSQSSQPTSTPEALHLLRRKLVETRKLHSILLAERNRNASYITQLQSLLTSREPSQPSLGFLTQSPAAQKLGLSNSSANGGATLTQYTQQAVSQLPALRQLLSALGQKEQEGLKYARHGAAADERREYIESQVRRRLEREGADVSTGEGLIGKSGDGRTVAGEDVRGIESVAGLVGRDTGGGTGSMEE